MTPTVIVKVTKLSKNFDTNCAVNNVNFSLNSGDIVALIGPNGSGKTTLIKTIVGLHFADKGSVTINNFDITKESTAAKNFLGYVPDNPSGFDFLTGKELLNLTASLRMAKFPTAPLKTLIKQFQLDKLLDQRLSNYSRGNRQKLAFVAALIGQPQILLIDEPIVGLDPESIEIFGSKLKDFATQGGAILFSTHILEFGKRFANRLLVMHQGKIKLDTKVTNKTSLTRQYQKLTK